MPGCSTGMLSVFFLADVDSNEISFNALSRFGFDAAADDARCGASSLTTDGRALVKIMDISGFVGPFTVGF